MHRNQLKLLALLTMTIDHIGAFVLSGNAYLWMRVLGRLAFPIFIFLFAEGAHHSKAKRRDWGLILLGFALVTQFLLNWVNAGFVNIFFLFFLGLIGFEASDRGHVWVFIPLALVAEYFKVDYGMYGIAAMAFFYLLEGKRKQQLVSFALTTIIYVCLNIYGSFPTFNAFVSAMGIVFSKFDIYWVYFIQLFAIAALVPIAFYHPLKNKRIANPTLYLVWKYFFYVYYPLHIVVLCLIGIR